MTKSNFKCFVTICAVSLFAVSSANAQTMGGLVLDADMEGMATPSFFKSGSRSSKPTIGAHASDAEMEEWVKLKLPNFAKEDLLIIEAQKVKTPEDNSSETAELNFGKTKHGVLNELIETSVLFSRNMVKQDLDNACKSNGSAQNCTETFEAAANVVAVLDPNKGGAAEWTGRKAKEVSDDLVKLGGTQEQLMDVVQFATSNVKFIEQSLPSNTRIDGPKEAAAVNLVKAVVNITNMKQAAIRKEDEANQTATNVLSMLNTIKSMNVVSVNNNIIAPTMNSMRLIDSVSETYDTESGLSTWNSMQINKFKLDSYLNSSLSNYQNEKARQSKQSTFNLESEKPTIDQYYVGLSMGL